ncbi:MAG: MATE family efflux transporter, partial [Anaerolineae bacterium]|nr:MATE family efflux transporter [Anaerolineae bacterium]
MSTKLTQSPSVTQGEINQVIFSLAWPSVVSQVLFQIPSIYDAFWLGKIGPEAQAAAGLAMAIRITMISLLMALSAATGAVVARFLGAGDQEKADAATFNGVVMMVLTSGALGIFGLLFTSPLMKLAGASPDVLPLAVRYSRILFAGLIAMELVPSMGGVFTAAGVPKLRLSMMSCTVGTILIAEPFLMKWWGLEGTVAALVLAHTTGMFWGFSKLIQGHYAVRINLHKMILDKEMMWRILKIASPAVVQRGFPNLAMVILIRLISGFGAQTLAAWMIVRTLSTFALLVAQGISGISGAMVGQNLGAKKPERAKMAVRVISRAVLFISSAILIILAVFAPGILNLFSNDPMTLNTAVSILRVLVVGYIAQALSWVYDSALVGAGDTVSPMLVYSFMWALQLPLAFLLSKGLNYGTMG